MKKEIKIILLAAISWWGYRMLKKGYSTTLGKSKEIDLLARTAWGEARGEGMTGMKMIMLVIMNRVKKGGWWGDTVEDVVKKHSISGVYQFTCWNPDDPNYNKMLAVNENNSEFKAALNWASEIYAGNVFDSTYGATHYHSTAVKPYWADASKMTVQHGTHIFYSGIA